MSNITKSWKAKIAAGFAALMATAAIAVPAMGQDNANNNSGNANQNAPAQSAPDNAAPDADGDGRPCPEDEANSEESS